MTTQKAQTAQTTQTTQKAQKAQMDLDQAIDAVAQRMTRVEDDRLLAARIMDSLPERRRGFWWLLAPVAATLAAAILAFVHTDVPAIVPTNVQPNVQPNVPTVVQANVPTNVPTNVRPNDRMNGRMNGRMNDRMNVRMTAPDFERALPALAVVDALSMPSLAAPSLPEEQPLATAPLTVEALSLDPVQR